MKKNKKLMKKSFLRKRGSGGLNKKWKEIFLNAIASVIKKGPPTSIRKHANELKIHEKTLMRAIKQDLNPEFTFLITLYGMF